MEWRFTRIATAENKYCKKEVIKLERSMSCFTVAGEHV